MKMREMVKNNQNLLNRQKEEMQINHLNRRRLFRMNRMKAQKNKKKSNYLRIMIQY
jgi:hypothetical protein